MLFDGGESPTKKNIQKYFLNYYFFKSVQIYMKDPESNESNKKSNLRFFRLLFYKLISLIRKSPAMSWNEWKINFPIFIFWVMVDFVHNFQVFLP